jgi:hypothetical protein
VNVEFSQQPEDDPGIWTGGTGSRNAIVVAAKAKEWFDGANIIWRKAGIWLELDDSGPEAPATLSSINGIHFLPDQGNEGHPDPANPNWLMHPGGDRDAKHSAKTC